MTWKPSQSAEPRRSGRAVSDVVAFVFVFSIIITSVGLVSAVGFSALEDFKANEQSVNAERGFESLGYNLGNIQRGHAPGRSGEIKLSGGRILVNQSSTMEVTTPSGWSRTFDMGTLRYDMEARDTSVAYESGAVFRRDRGGVYGISRPKLTCNPTEGYALVSIVTLESDEGTRGGDGTVQVIGREQSSELVRYETPTAGDVTVDVDSQFEQGWDQFFEDGWTNPSGGVGQCNLPPGSTVIVRHTVIEIQFVS